MGEEKSTVIIGSTLKQKQSAGVTGSVARQEMRDERTLFVCGTCPVLGEAWVALSFFH